MGVLSLSMGVSIGMAAFAIVVSGCGASSGLPAAESTTAESAAMRPPPLACEQRIEVTLDHFGLGKGAGSPEAAAAPYQAEGSTLVVDEGGGTATIHVVSADGDETLAIMGASNWRGWRIDTIESCARHAPKLPKP